jgi:hypothetical protein
MLLSSWCISVLDFSAVCCFGCGWSTCFVQTGSLEAVYFCLETLPRQITNKNKFCNSGHHHTEAHFCVSGCGGIELAQHLFLLCNTIGSLWLLVRSCINFLSVDFPNLSDHFLRFTYSSGVFNLLLDGVFFIIILQPFFFDSQCIFQQFKIL